MNQSSAPAHLASGLPVRSETVTRLRGSWLTMVRVLCIVLCLLSVGLFVASILAYIVNNYLFCTSTAAACFAHGQLTPGDVQRLRELGLSRDFIALYPIVLNGLLALGYWVVAAFLFWRKSDDWVALLAAVNLALVPIVFNYGLTSALPSPWWFVANVLSFLGSLGFVLFYYVFPSGHFVPGFTRWLLVVGLVYWGLNEFFPHPSFNPFYRVQLLNGLTYLGLVVSTILAQIYRYRRVSSPEERQQTKWVLYGVVMGQGVYLLVFTISLFIPSVLSTGSLVSVIRLTVVYVLSLLTPLSIGFAIVRARLWDIDVIINRTLVYGILTLCVAGLYVGIVGSLGTLVGTSNNLLISLGATGLVAVLFQPLRAWLQRGVNRLLYGQRDEPYAVITQLSQRLERTLAPEAALPALVETVAQALKLPYAAILLKQGENFRLAASVGELAGEPVTLPLVYQSETSGQLQLAPRSPGESFSAADRRLLEELARQAGMAAHAVQLTADLQRSYEQLELRVEERTRELSSLLEISQTVASTLQLRPLLGVILDQLKLVIDYTGSSVLTVEGDRLIFLDHRGPVPEEQFLQLAFSLERLGPIWHRMVAGESIVIPDIYVETPLAEALRVAMGDMLASTFAYVRSWMAVPLRLRDQVSGMLVVTSEEAQAFTPHQATLALAVANQAAIAIENARLYAQAQELAAVEERQKLARELHDSVSQALYGISLGLHTARIQVERDPLKLPQSLTDLLSLAEAALAEMRALIFELRPESLEREGLVAALAKQGAALQARTEMSVQTNLCEEPALPLPAKQALYRIAQEALHNTVKHAHATKVDLHLTQTDALVTLEVRDDGIGFDPRGSFPGHLGLRSMQERISDLGGTFQIESVPGQGTHVLAQVPAGTTL